MNVKIIVVVLLGVLIIAGINQNSSPKLADNAKLSHEQNYAINAHLRPFANITKMSLKQVWTETKKQLENVFSDSKIIKNGIYFAKLNSPVLSRLFVIYQISNYNR